MTPSPADPALVRAVKALAAGAPLGELLTAEAFGEVMRGEGSPALVGALLLGLRIRGESADEITGAVRALRDAMIRVSPPAGANAIDTCGTGGGAVTTFNISTAAGLVAAAAGAVVAKHGNRSFTSRCGSADVLEALGVAITLDRDAAERLLERVGMAFLFAPVFHPAMRHLAPVRRELGVTTVMNIVGPLANPAGVRRQVLGVADGERAPVLAHVLARLGAEHALVVHAAVGMDEIAPIGETHAFEVQSGEVRRVTVNAERLGVAVETLDALAGSEPDANAERIRRLFESPSSDPAGRAAVVLNAGAACYVAGLADSLEAGVECAAAALDGGRAADTLARLVEQSRAVSTGG